LKGRYIPGRWFYFTASYEEFSGRIVFLFLIKTETMIKKIIIIFFMACLCGMNSQAQVAINTDGSFPDEKAMLDVKSSAKGFLPPRMTKSEMNAIAGSITPGMVIFCTDCNNGSGCLSVYDGAWRCAGNQPVFETSCGTFRVYYPVSAAGHTWLDRNMGASRVAISSADYQAYGSLYQWGRQSDNHQCISWTNSTTGAPQYSTTSVQCAGGICPDALFVMRASSPFDWNNTDIYTLWNGTTRGINDPCPSGYRVPTQAELEALNSTFSPQTSAGAFSSPLKLTAAGDRVEGNGFLNGAGGNGIYWSSTYNSSSTSYFLSFSPSASGISIIDRANGLSVRCIAE
jgi:uncharacterized protein (TIGR02145 family)